MAQKIGLVIGVKMIRRGSNESSFKGKHTVIECANVKTTSVGVSYRMLPRLDSVITAFRRTDGEFDPFSLSATSYAQHMINTPAAKAHRKTGSALWVKSYLKSRGEQIGTVRIDE